MQLLQVISNMADILTCSEIVWSSKAMCVNDFLANSVCVCSHLDRGVSHDALSPLYNGEVGEAELVCCLDQTHAVPPHLQENIFDLD